jgi:hypothetical protein
MISFRMETGCKTIFPGSSLSTPNQSSGCQI